MHPGGAHEDRTWASVTEVPQITYVDVFGQTPLLGNPVAVVHDASALDDATMAAFARWTNLSETTFLLPATRPDADYRVRIWTTDGELPFAGHPTLGTAHAWLQAGGVPHDPDWVMQECAAGLIRVRRQPDRLWFAAPPMMRSGPVAPDVLAQALASVGLSDADLIEANWVDNGPGWLGLHVTDAAAVLRAVPDVSTMGDLKVGLVGRYLGGGPADVEVRAFYPGLGSPEDPVTGSLNASLAQWLIGSGSLPSAYIASQGTALGRAGRVHIRHDDGDVWVGGATVSLIRGTFDLR